MSWYCGNKCQKKAWKRLGHRTRCGAAAPTRQSITRADAAEAVAVLREWHGVHSILPLVALYRVSKLCDDGGSAMQLLTDEDLFKASVLVMQAHPWAAQTATANAARAPQHAARPARAPIVGGVEKDGHTIAGSRC